MFHFTDHKIRVHVLYCLLGFMATRLIFCQAAEVGIRLSVRELLDTLACIQETILLCQGE